jgi:hypothetical protein
MEEGHWEKLKMFALGGIVGIAVTLVVGFKQDFIFTKAAMADAVEQGEVLTLANVCVGEAKRDLIAQQKEAKAFKGFDNYKKRDAFVETVMSHLHISKELSVYVSSKCSELLS